MRSCKPGIRESALGSVFDAYCLENYNCKFLPYNQICACGLNPAVLHYPGSNDLIPPKMMCLIDMGHAVHHYCADITCCYPSDGVFTQKQKDIYRIVYKANRAVFKVAKPGVSWPSMHILAERIILTDLQKLGIVKPEVDIEKALDARLGFLFMPHGLGHLVGLDVHEVGGYLPHFPPRSGEWGLKSL